MSLVADNVAGDPKSGKLNEIREIPWWRIPDDWQNNPLALEILTTIKSLSRTRSNSERFPSLTLIKLLLSKSCPRPIRFGA